ncbi:protein-disulfide reductase DsbD domain-containing protein [Actibacterium pelagium]|nr:protein-disulfide reductase DsbD domain-containing protein [Actibacterium pelagium]
MSRRISKILGLMMALVPLGAAAQDFSEVAQVEYLSGWTTKSGSHMAALSITLEPGWKTYWRKPGEAGIPPVFDWGGSKNLQSVALHWPTPKVFKQDIFYSVGYAEQLILPIELYPSQPGKPVSVKGSLQIGVCKDVCVPVELEFTQTGAIDNTPAIRAALADQPVSGKKAGIGKVVCQIAPISDGLQMTLRMKAPQLGGKDYVIVELADPTIWVSEAKMQHEGGQIVATVDMVPANAAPFSLNRSDVRITVLGDKAGIDIQGCSGS